MPRISAVFLLVIALCGATLAARWFTAAATNPLLERQSVTSTGQEAHGTSSLAAVSGDGRYVAFASNAPDMLPNNGPVQDIFLRDRQTGATELVSVATDGAEPNGVSLFPDVSSDGRYVAFESFAGDIVADDGQGYSDIFVRDRLTGTSRRVNLTPEGSDLDNDSLTPSISSSGRYVTYTSLSGRPVPDDTNSVRDVFLVDLETNLTERISVASDGTQGDLDSGGLGAGEGRVTADGRYVVFGSFASTLVAGDDNLKDDIFVRDRVAGTTQRVSVSTGGDQGNDHSMYGSISENGRYVAFFSTADNLVADDTNGVADVFLHDRTTSQTSRISGGIGKAEANAASRFPDVSADGRYVVFQSAASNLVAGDNNDLLDIFRYDTMTGITQRLSVPNGGGEAQGSSTDARISDDGAVVVFQSLANNLSPNDLNFASDVFAWGKVLGAIPTPTPVVTSTPTPSGRIGDANVDGRIDSIDAALILQRTAGLLSVISPAADANVDGRIDSIDAALVLQYTAGLLPVLPP